MSFKFLEHTADIKFLVSGKNLNDVFRSSAQALSSYIAKEAKIKKTNKKNIKLESNDNEGLLYKFLDELIFLLDAENFIVADAKVSIKGNKLTAVIFGEDSRKKKNLTHVKAATYAEMHVKNKGNNWEAQFVIDV